MSKIQSSEEKYRRVKIPKQNWEVEEEKPKITKEIIDELRTVLNEFAENKKVDAHKIQQGLRSISNIYPILTLRFPQGTP